MPGDPITCQRPRMDRAEKVLSPSFLLPICFPNGMGWGYIYPTGETAIPPVFSYANRFSEGLAAVQDNGFFGYIETSGTLAMPSRFLEAEDFSAGLAVVCDKETRKYGMIDRTGKYRIPPNFDSLALPTWGLSLASSNGKCGFIDGAGCYRIPPVYDNGDCFDECGWACVEQNGDCLFIGLDGKPVLRVDCEYASPFYTGLSIIRKNGKYGCIDRTGKIVTPCIYDELSFAEEGTFAVKENGKWMFTDYFGTPLFNTSFDNVSPFAEGFAGICRSDLWGFIAHDGNPLISPMFLETGAFQHSVAQIVSTDGEMRYLHISGKQICICQI